jgi:glycogen debranching enzyme
VRNRLALVPRFQSDRDSLDRVLSRAVGDLLAMLSQTPDGLYPYAGIPWYCAPFGRDGSITALQLLPWMPEVARGVLLFQARHQAHDFDDFTDREPGKVFHELRTGEMAALREIPFVPYYGSADATPLFLILLAEYVRVTDDVALLERLWPHALAALEWIERYGDADGDGFVEYAARSPLGLRNQGWKDSFDGISHEDGRLAEPPVAVCEVQAYVVRAYRGCAELAERRGDRERARVWSHRAGELQRRLHESFWLDDLAIYALALDRDKRPCRVATSNAGHVLWAGAAYDAQARAVGAQLMSPELFSGFGVRTLATGARRYSPLAYHNGSVWPHDNALVAEGLRRCGMASAFFDVFGGVLAAVEQAPEQRVPELYCGFRRAGDDKPVPYPVACAPQAWSSGAMLHFVRTMLGLSVDGRSRTVEFDHPALPPWLDRLDVTGLWVPGGSLRFRAERHGNASSIEVVEKPDALDIVVRE